MSGRIKLIIPFAIILFPVVFWLVLTTGKNNFKTLPVLGPVHVDEKGDTVYHEISGFELIDQNGNVVSRNDLLGKIVVANFFFSNCKTIGPQMSEQIQRLQGLLHEKPDVRFISFSIDPDHDSVSVLSAYAKNYNADASRWFFLTGNKDSIYNLARNSFLVNLIERDSGADFIHSPDLILLDDKGRIRGVYDGTEAAEVDTLKDEVKILLYELRMKSNS